VIGAVVNDGDSPIQISLQADLGASAPTQTLLRVEATGTSIGRIRRPDGDPQLPYPRWVMAISAATASGARPASRCPCFAEGEYTD